MTDISPQTMHVIVAISAAVTVGLLIASATGGNQDRLNRRMARVRGEGRVKKINTNDRVQHAVMGTQDSKYALLDRMAKMLPNPDKLRRHLARTGKEIPLGEYLVINICVVGFVFLIAMLFGMSKPLSILLSIMLGFGLPHMVTGYMGSKRIKKFLANFPEAIDTMVRGIRSGLPITESIAAAGREMPDPVGIEFRRISDGVRVGKSLEQAMWEVAHRLDTPEYRFLIIAMAIQKETGGNLGETLGNLADLIRRRRQLRLKIKAMSSEAKASAMIIGSLPFIMFVMLMIVSHDYMIVMFQSFKGKAMLGIGVAWMSMGWGMMTKMIHFEL